MEDHRTPPPTDAQPPTPKPPQLPTPATNPSPALPMHVVDTADAVLARPSRNHAPPGNTPLQVPPAGHLRDGSRPRGSTEPGRLLLTVVQAAEMLAIGRTTVYQLISAGDLEVVHIGRATRVPVAAVEDLVTRLRRRAS
jgi:excisionase family DNA binding protein